MPENLFLITYLDELDYKKVGLQVGEAAYELPSSTLLSLFSGAIPITDIIEYVQANRGEPTTVALDRIRKLDGMYEIWAAGVTYKRSEEARERESHNSTIYTRVYSAQRPELFYKSTSYYAVGNGDPVGIRFDATWSVPEPELCVALSADMEVIGFTIGNDMSSRDIEGENALYLPQAKVYDGSCAIGPRLWLQPGRSTWPELGIRLTISRDGQSVFAGETSTANLHRTLTDLVDYLGRCKQFPNGVLLLTGTGIVPPDDFTLKPDDEVRIQVDPIGELVNRVAVVGRKK